MYGDLLSMKGVDHVSGLHGPQKYTWGLKMNGPCDALKRKGYHLFDDGAVASDMI